MTKGKEDCVFSFLSLLFTDESRLIRLLRNGRVRHGKLVRESELCHLAVIIGGKLVNKVRMLVKP